MVNVAFSVTVEHSDVYAPILITGPESQSCRGVEEIGIENYRSIVPVRDVDSAGVLLLQEGSYEIRTAVVCGKVPRKRSVDIVDDKSAGWLIKVGIFRCDPEIHVHCREIGMKRGVCRQVLSV